MASNWFAIFASSYIVTSYSFGNRGTQAIIVSDQYFMHTTHGVATVYSLIESSLLSSSSNPA